MSKLFLPRISNGVNLLFLKILAGVEVSIFYLLIKIFQTCQKILPCLQISRQGKFFRGGK
ncbi:MAG: hypothetical protein QMC93_03485 [Patescibacteria group bacterium]|nr:hypothetical protein [Patescibacteria group bacterium]